METNTYSMGTSAYSYTTYKEEENVFSFEKLMESFKIPKEYYKAADYEKKFGIPVSEWMKLYKETLSKKPEEFWDSKDIWETPEKNHLPDDLFEI